jgi:NADPH:quinone reductase-like Zn-dependent oxidoreductase
MKDGAERFSPGDVFGQLLIAPLGSAGTYAEDVAVREDAPLAPVPDCLAVTAAIPMAGATALDIVESLDGAARREDGPYRRRRRRRRVLRDPVCRERPAPT